MIFYICPNAELYGLVLAPRLKKDNSEFGEKNCVYKNQGREPIHRKYKANEDTSKHNPKKKQKQTINKNKVKALCKGDS
jgi:hypothetical protein